MTGMVLITESSLGAAQEMNTSLDKEGRPPSVKYDADWPRFVTAVQFPNDSRPYDGDAPPRAGNEYVSGQGMSTPLSEI